MRHLLRLAVTFLAMVVSPNFAYATPTVQLSGYLTISSVSTYPDGFVVQVAASVNGYCTWPSTLQIYTSNTNYNAHVATFLTAYSLGKQIRVFHFGCGPTSLDSGGGNVYVYGWVIND